MWKLEPPVDDSPHESLSADQEVVSEIGAIVNEFPRVSSPLCYWSFDCSLPTKKEKPECPQQIDATESAGGTPLVLSSTVTVLQATALLDLFNSRFSLSDKASTAVFSVTKALLPTDNCLHSDHSLVRQMKQDMTRASLISWNGNEIILNFCKQLKMFNEIYNNVSIILKSGEKNVKQDLNPSIAPITCIQMSLPELNILISRDGVNIKKSTYKKELWPIGLQRSDMQPILQMPHKSLFFPVSLLVLVLRTGIRSFLD